MMTAEWAKVYVQCTRQCVSELSESVIRRSIATLRQTLTVLQAQEARADAAFMTEVTRAVHIMEDELARRGLARPHRSAGRVVPAAPLRPAVSSHHSLSP